MVLPLPFFELGPLEAVEPKALVKNAKTDPVGALMLALALAFNNLKDVTYFVFWAWVLREEADSDTLARRGQFHGMQHHLARMLCGIAHEVTVLLWENKAAVESAEFQSCVTALSAEYLEDWHRVWKAAQGVADSDARDPLSRLLLRVRNNLAYHYSAKALAQGYCEHFDSESGRDHSQFALIADGNSMQAVRFYFADDAAVAYRDAVLDMTDEQIEETAKRLNRVLHALIRTFVDGRAPERSAYEPRE